MKSASAGNTSGEDFSSLGDELFEFSYILVIDIGCLVLTENANLLSSVHVGTEGSSGFVLFHCLFLNLSDSRYFITTRHTVSLGAR